MSTRRDRNIIQRALAGERKAISELVDMLTPIIQARVARVLLAHGHLCGRTAIRTDIEDFTQDVFVSLFEESGRVLRNWRAHGGLSLANYAGLVAHRRALSNLRSGKRNPWTEAPTCDSELEEIAGEGTCPEQRVASRELLQRAFLRVEEQLTPYGMVLFQELLIAEHSVSEVAKRQCMTQGAVYAWRSRLLRAFRREIQKLMSNQNETTRIPGRRTTDVG